MSGIIFRTLQSVSFSRTNLHSCVCTPPLNVSYCLPGEVVRYSAEDISCTYGTLMFMMFSPNLPLNSVPSQFILIHTFTSYFSNIDFNIILSSTPRPPKWSLPLRFTDWRFGLISHFLMHAICPTFLNLTHLITRTILGKVCKFQHFPCNFLRSFATSTLQILSQRLFPQIFSIYVLPLDWSS